MSLEHEGTIGRNGERGKTTLAIVRPVMDNTRHSPYRASLTEPTAMKTGMNLLLWTGQVTEEHYPLLAKLKQTGYDGVELPLFAGDAAHYKTVRKELDANGLGATAVTVVNANNNPISPDAAIR